MMKRIIIFTIVCNILFSTYYASYININKSWVITTKNASKIKLIGFGFVDNQFQKIINIKTNGEIFRQGDFIKIKYEEDNPNTTKNIYIRAYLYINYPEVYKDSKFTNKINKNIYPKDFTNIAVSCVNKSSVLNTLLCLNKWIYYNMNYDIRYYSKNISEIQAFRERRGVCFDYSKILSGFLKILNIKHRMITGYVIQNNSVTAHSWVEVLINNQTIPIDPTFNQIGQLSSNRVITYYKTNKTNSSLEYTYLESNDKSIKVETHVNMSINKTRKICETPKININYNNSSGIIKIIIYNTKNKSLFLKYSILSPKEIMGIKKEFILLKPYGKKIIKCNLSEKLEENIEYKIPIIINTTCDNKKIEIKYKKERNKKDVCINPVLIIFLGSLCIYPWS